MTKLGLAGWLVSALALGGCTTVVTAGGETGGGIQDPETADLVVPNGTGGGGGAPAEGTSGQGGSGTATAAQGTSSGSGSGGAPPSTGSVVPGPEIACPDHARTILIETQGPNARTMRFDPVTYDVTDVDYPSCSINALAMTRDGTLWTTAQSDGGVIRRIDEATSTCQAFADPAAVDDAFEFFDMAAVRDDGDGPEERLWLASMDWNGLGPTQLASVDVDSGIVDVVGSVGDGEFMQMLLTGTADGRIIGLGVENTGTPSIIDIDRTDGALRSKVPFSVEQFEPQTNSIAMAFWGDALYVFLGETEGAETSTTVVRHMLDGSAPDTAVATFEGAAMRAASTPCDAIAAL